MKQLLYGLSLTALLGMTTIVSLPETASAQTNRQCAAAISRAKAKIRSVRNATIKTSQSYSLSDMYENFPSQRPTGYGFSLEGRGLDKVPTLAISKNIINNCPSIGLVTFNQWRTDATVYYGLMPNGKIKEFESCSSLGFARDGKMYWGYAGCE